MAQSRRLARPARRYWKWIFAAVVLAGIAAGVWGLRQYQRERIIQAALISGKAAFASGEWDIARQQLSRYLSRYGEDFEILEMYAQSEMNCRPLAAENIVRAATAYRVMLRVRPAAVKPFEQLAAIYETTGNATELEQIARQRLAAINDTDARALLILARAQSAAREPEQARLTLEKLANLRPSQSAPEDVLIEGLGALVELTSAEGGEVGRAATRRALENALARFPRSQLLRALRAHLLTAWSITGSAAERDAAAASLADACEPLPDDPAILLALSETAMIQQELDRARDLLRYARSLEPPLVAKRFVDPEGFDVAWFQRAGTLSAIASDAPLGATLARESLARIMRKGNRLAILPLAVELLARANEGASARTALEEYLTLIGELPHGAVSGSQIAMLKAVVAMAEDRPYEVINLLEPLRSSATFPPLATLLLNEAYVATNQSIRIAASGAVAGPGGGVMAVSQARGVVQALAERGAWDAILATIATLPEDMVKADPDLRIASLGARLEQALAARAPQQRLEELMAETRALRDEFPKRADVAVLFASVAQTNRDHAAAVAELTRASKECEPAELPLIALARIEAGNDNRQRALELLRETTQRAPERISAWLALAGLQYEMDKPDDALATLDAATASDAGKTPERQRRLRQRRAVLLIAKGDRPAGEQALRALAAESPTDVEVRSLLLDLPDALNDSAAAQKLVDEIKSVEGNAGLRWRFQQARILLTQPDWQSHANDARELLTYCIGADRNWVAPVLLLGGLQRRTGDVAAAEATYRAGLASTQDPAIADQLLALLQTQRRFSDAREILARVEQRLSEEASTARRVSLAVGEGRYGDAIAALEARGAGGAGAPADLVRMAQIIYAQRRDSKAALSKLDEAEKAGAEALVVGRVRASILLNDKRPDEALAVLNELVAKLNTAEAYLLRGSFLASLDRQADADADFAKVFSLSDDETGYALQGEHFAQTNRLSEAIAVWEAGLKRFPTSTMLKRGLVKARIMRNQPDDPPAIEKLLAALGDALPGDPEVIWLRAANLHRLNPRDSTAVRGMLAEAERGPQAPVDVYRGLTDLAGQIGDAKLALALALRGLTFYPTDPILHTNRAEAMLAQRDPRGAREAARSALASDKGQLRALELLAVIARETNDPAAYREPLDALAAICDAQPGNEAAHLLRAQVMRLAGDAPGSLGLLRKFRESVPAAANSVALLLESAESSRAAGDPAAAEALLKDAETSAPAELRVFGGWLAHYANLKRFDELAAFAEQRLDMPETTRLLLAAAGTLSEQPSHIDAAVRLAEKVIRHEPANAAAHFLIGNLAYGRGQIDRAERAFRAAVEADSSAAAAMNNLAWLVASDQGKYDEALGLAQKAVALAPAEYNYHDTLAFVLEKKADLDGARREYIACLGLPTLPPAGRPAVLLKLVKIASRLKDNGPLRPLLSELQQLRRVSPAEWTPEDRAALDAVIQSMGTSE